MTLRFDFFYENADVKYFLALLQKLANACEVDLRAESSAEILSVFASAESSEILGKFADFLQVEVPHSLYFKLKNAELCNEVRGEKIALDLDGIFSVSEINAIRDIKSPRFCEIDSACSAESKLNPCEAPENSPASWCKKSGEASSSASADFLLEAEKRGSPPKSEKRQLLARRGSGAGGAALLREKTREVNSQKSDDFAESKRDFSPTAQNDKIMDCNADSVNLLAMTENKDFAESSLDSANLKSTLQNICTLLQSGQSVALNTSRGEILLSTKNEDFDFILANDIATLNLYTRATQDEISALASFEKPLIELAIKEVFVREVGAKCAKFILPFDIALCCLSSMLLAQNIAFVRGKFAESSKFFEIVVGQNGYFLHKNYADSADFAEFWNINFGAQSCAKNSVIASEQGERGNPQNIIIYLSLQNPSIFACGGEKIINIAFDKNPKNILQKITNLENGDKLIANFKRAFEARYEAIFTQDCAPQWTQNLLDIFECAAMILGCECDKSAIFDLASGYLRDIGPKIDFKNRADNSILGMQFRTKNTESSADSANHSLSYLSNSHISFAKRAAPPAPLPLRAKKLRFFAFRGRASLSPLLAKNQRSHYCSLESDFLHHEAGEFSGASHGFNVDSADSQNLQNGLPREQSSLAMTKDKNFAESSADSANHTKIAESTLFYDELKTIRSIISFTLAGAEREVVAFGIVESLVDYLVLLFREAQNQFGAKNICIAGDMFANKVFFDKITKKIPTDFKLIFPKYLDISSARRASCKT